MKKLFWGDTSDKNPGILLLRIFAGAAMLVHGVPKMFGGMEGFTKFVASMNVPAPGFMALMAALTESLGALLLVLGLGTRVVAFLLVCNMSVAAFVAHGGDPFAMQEKALLYLVIYLAFYLKGAGKWSLDSLIRSGLSRKNG